MARKYDFECEVFENKSLLDKDIQNLVDIANKQLDTAYAPYSKFLVGAAVLLSNGNIYKGCNQENASYPLCICAERVALFNMGANEKSFKIKALVITASNPSKPLEEVCMPCGACRQVIQEFENRQNGPIPIYLTSEQNEIVKIDGISKILPASFSMRHLL
ncbi:MAG: cytidine deaminase [Saprospiraceae bacterium]|nr:cytidine deaminase [Bacteroidia bacterium]NNE16745.1 cytidine deaminase [Saprospiraceae bacterium]NNL92647.1 cytidine deaminase [Saprospiraceae bacterium]